jgi:transposase
MVVANPREVRNFAEATGQLAKTDRIDASVLALVAERVRPEPRPLPDAEAELLAPLNRVRLRCPRCHGRLTYQPPG